MTRPACAGARASRLTGVLAALAMGLAATFGGGPVQANPYESYLDARLLPGWRASSREHVAGLELTLAPGWKTYWRAPGSAGIPPSFDWSGSTNVAAVEIVWPSPEVFDSSGSRSIGYHDHVVLPLKVTPRDPSQPVTLKGTVDLGICESVCVPLQVSVAAALPAGETRRAPNIAAAMAGRPFTPREAKLREATCRVSPASGGLIIEARLVMPSAGAPEVTVIETALPDLMVGPTETSRQGNVLTARAEVISLSGGMVHLDRSRLRITVLGRDYAVEVPGCTAG